MKLHCIRHGVAVVATFVGLGLTPYPVEAHCDSLEGPVVQDARRALEQGDPTPVLKWVSPAREAEIRAAFQQTLAVRGKGDDAQRLADRYFFETLVRLHRAGEGEAFTGLTAASAVEPGITAADQALHTGSAKDLVRELSTAISDGIQQRFTVAQERQKQAATSVEAGRAYVEAYVDYIHFVESVHRLVSEGVSHRHPAADSHREP